MRLPAETSRLIIRDFVADDIPEIIKIITHPKFAGYSRFRPKYASEDVTRFIERAIQAHAPDPKTGRRELYRLAVCLKNDPKQAIGYCVFDGWSTLSKDNDQVGYFLHPDHQGKGYAREAVHWLLGEYFLHYPERPAYATVHPSNAPSRKLLEGLGFSPYGKKTIEVDGQTEPRVIYSIGLTGLKA